MRLLIAALAALLLAPAAHAEARVRPDRVPAVVEARADSLHPEGIAWDPIRRAFLVSSIRHGTVSVVRPDGQVRTLVSDPRMVSTFGLRVDARRGRLLVVYADMGLGVRSSPETEGVQSGVGVYDLRTGRPLHLVDLSIGPGKHTANDLALDRSGTGYVTDPSSDTLYRVTPDGHGSVFARDPRFASPTIGLNGIVWHPAGFLLTSRYDDGGLFRIPVQAPAKVSAVRLPSRAGTDGLLLHRDGSLAAVTNTLAARSTDAVTTFRSSDGWRSARLVRIEPWASKVPTTIASSPSGDYAVSGRLDVLLNGGTADDFVLRRSRFH